MAYPINPLALRTAAGICAALLRFTGVSVLECGQLRWFSFSEWTPTPDARLCDRLWFVHESGARVEMTGEQFYGMDRDSKGDPVPLWQANRIPPAYPCPPKGGKVNGPEIPLFARMTLTEDATYFGGEVIRRGTVVIMVGYRSKLDLRGHSFDPYAVFPDGTCRHLPATAEPAPDA